jgi:deazaflavin-dependent oxidoreductase (nitroreductase family)
VTAPADPSARPFCYLTTTGRRSGRPHRIEIWFALHHGTVYLLSGDRDGSDWVRNLQASAAVTLELGDEVRATTARVIDPGSPEDPLARRLLVEKYQPGYGSDLGSWGREALPVAVAWDEGGPPPTRARGSRRGPGRR